MANHWLVFSDDWGRHPSSCQHLIGQLLGDVEVTWVNTIGMRPPRFDLITLRRGIEKLSGWTRKDSHHQGNVDPGTAGPEPTVIDAKMWPWMSRPWDRRVNQQLLTRQLREVSRDATVITTIPIVADLVDRLPAKRWIYYCVDDFSVWPGMDQPTMVAMERQLVAKVHDVVAVSDVLQRRIAEMNREASLLTHGVDLGHWSLDEIEPFGWPDHVKGPVALFWGVVDQRLDAEFVIELASRMQQGSVVLVGPVQSPDPRLNQLDNVHFLDAVPYQMLPSLAKAADCLIMPYVDAEVTRAMQPLKLKEYLATGRPVVARKLPSTSLWHDCLDVASNKDEFAGAVVKRLGDGVCPDQTLARKRLCDHSWVAKASEFRSLVQG